MSERQNYKTLRMKLPQGHDRLDRIENVVVTGMPDINFCSNGVESWLEMKSPVEPKRPTTPLFGSNHKLSQAQMNWMLRQTKAGGRCFILIATDKRWMLIDGSFADNINKMTIQDLIMEASWHTTKPVEKNDWRFLRSILIAGGV